MAETLTELEMFPAFFPQFHHSTSLYCQLLQPVFHLHHSTAIVHATDLENK